MYESYFGFREKPFSIAPDPRFVYLSPAHEEALAHLAYGVAEGGGFVLLSGEVGTGKTTLVRTLLDQLPAHVDVALIFNPRQSPVELVASVCDELGIDRAGVNASIKDLVDLLNRHLLETYARGRRTVLLVDEAQALPPEVLEQIRLLTNLETTREKLLEIILVGQPEIRDTLARTDLRQLAQRITARYHLAPLNCRQVAHYVQHRVGIAGGDPALFTRGAVAVLARLSGGIPRLINEIADRSLLGAYAEEKRQVAAGLVREAAGQVLGSPPSGLTPRLRSLGIGLAATALIVLAVAVFFRFSPVVPQLELMAELMAPWRGGNSSGAVAVEDPTGAPDNAAGGAAGNLALQVTPEGVAPSIDAALVSPGSPGGYADELSEGAAFSVWLEQEQPRLTETAAFAQLRAIWRLPEVVDGDPASLSRCGVAADGPVHCLSVEGSWDSLLQLDRPAVIRLTLEGNTPVYLTVSGLTRTDILFLVDGGERTFPRWAVRMHWDDEYTLLWPSDVAVKPELAPGDAHAEGVSWLRDRLEAALDARIPPEASPSVFDEALADALRTFQEREGLNADGRLSDETLLQLFAASSKRAGPRLWRGS